MQRLSQFEPQRQDISNVRQKRRVARDSKWEEKGKEWATINERCRACDPRYIPFPPRAQATMHPRSILYIPPIPYTKANQTKTSVIGQYKSSISSHYLFTHATQRTEPLNLAICLAKRTEVCLAYLSLRLLSTPENMIGV